MNEVIRDGGIIEINTRLPVIPLKEIIIYPYMIYPLLIGRPSSLKAIEESMLLNKMVFLAAQKDLAMEDPDRSDLYRVGVVAKVLQVLKLPNGLMKVLVEGVVRGKIRRFLAISDHFQAQIDIQERDEDLTPDLQAQARFVADQFREYVRLNRNIPDEILLTIDKLDDPGRLADLLTSHLQSDLRVKQRLLETPTVETQLSELARIFESETEILRIESELEDKVRNRIHKSQRNIYLQEQMRVIQDELGEDGEANGEFAYLADRIKKARMPHDAEEKAREELDKLRMTPPFSPEATVVRNYLDWLIVVPWSKKSKDNLDLEAAERILEEDHYGLRKPKERILEHLAVLKLSRNIKGPILCFVGPPGVGKTSLGRSVARAMGRAFVRISLGGVRDEAEIRGHRRTYIGSMPGKIIQSLKKAKTINPVFLLDEIDKMSMDFRGDPSSALLEVLDHEQNKAFNDHYLEVDYDLSRVLFITTANLESQIPDPLRDRLEIINLPGYLDHEKQMIADSFLIPRLLKQHGLKSRNLKIQKDAVYRVIRDYTREAGVRNLERELSAISRKVAREIVQNGNGRPVSVAPADLQKYLGVPKFPERKYEETSMIGSALGLAWTRFGGEILQIEVTLMQGKGELSLTGKLGDVMKESAKAALSYARTNAESLGIGGEFWKEKDIHIHVPEGATPKDGPSAGITIATALISGLANKRVRTDLAMTGEITLRGNVLAIGGLNEKLLAAKRSGIKNVIIPKENEPELTELSAEVTKGLNIKPVSKMDEVLELAFAESRCE
jgi:ATP-dependent Lon protease